MGKKGLIAGAAAVIAAFVLTACSVSIPADPNGTLDAVRGGILRVGVSPNGDLTAVDGTGQVSGSEPEAVEEFASTLDATVVWTVGSEEALVRGLENDSLDLVIAGLTDETPWMDKAGMTRPYREALADDGTTHKLVMLVPLGENEFLTELETFLARYTGEIQ
jgi:ABC-type amino acid transport substrate-binding protein